jgi:mycothiol synthase
VQRTWIENKEGEEMSPKTQAIDTITIPDAPQIPGLTFRRFRGPEDYPAMLAVIDGSKRADGIERTDTLENITRDYGHLTNCDPYRDTLFVEMDGKLVGYSRVWWWDERAGKRIFLHEGRGTGIRRAMLRYNEQRLREIAAEHPTDLPRLFESWASDTETQWEALLAGEGYQGVRYGFDMVRSDLGDISDLPLPEGLKVRVPRPEQYRAVWEAAREAFRDEWDYYEEEWSDEQFESFQQESTFDPSLWRIAWDGDQVAGMVLTFVNEAENEEYNRKRGYTEGICVRRPWRRRGLARALIARSFQVQKERGMTETALGVDAQNPSGALRLYESMGFRPVRRSTTYRKAME